MTYAVIEDKSGYLNNSFILELACKKLNLTAEAIEAKVGRYVKGKKLGELKGSLHWSKCVSGGWKKDFGVIYPNSTFGYYIADYNGNVLFGSDKEHHHLAELSHERWLNNPSAQKQHQEYLADCEAYQQKQIEDKQRLLDTAYSLNERYGTEFNDCVTWAEVFSFLDTLTETTQQVKEVRTMTLNQIKQEIASLLNVDSVNAKSLFELANCNPVVLTAIQSIEASQFNLRTTETWQALLNKLKGEGVNESLGEVSGESLQPTLINKSVKLTPKQLKQRFNDADIYCEKLGSKYQVQFKASSNNPSKIYTYSVNNYALIDLAEKFEIVTADEVKAYRNNDNRCYRVSEPINLAVLKEEKTVNPDMSPESLLWHCVDKYGWKADDVFEVVYSLFDVTNTEATSTIVATVTSDNITEFKGIPVDHFNFRHEAYIDAMLKDTSGVLISKYLGTYAVSFNDGEQRKSDISLLEAVKVANEWLGVNTVKVPSTEESLTPKIELFAKFTEYTFLMQCYLELIGYFYNLSSSLSEISSQLYLTWCSLTALCFKRYVLMPTIGSENHTKLLMIWHEATYNNLESKSIYA